MTSKGSHVNRDSSLGNAYKSSFLWKTFKMHSAIKAMPIQFIDSKCHVKKWKSCKIALSSYYTCLSRDLLLMPLRADTHTDTQKSKFTDEMISRNQVRMLSMPSLKIHDNWISSFIF